MAADICAICLSEPAELRCGAAGDGPHQFCGGCIREYVTGAARPNDGATPRGTLVRSTGAALPFAEHRPGSGRGGLGGELLSPTFSPDKDASAADKFEATSAAGQLPCPFFKSPGCACRALPPAAVLTAAFGLDADAADGIGAFVGALQDLAPAPPDPEAEAEAENAIEVSADAEAATNKAVAALQAEVEAALLRGQSVPCPGCAASWGKNDACIHMRCTVRRRRAAHLFAPKDPP